jgi:carbon-monoxide dehydrogenase medium subunit
MYAFTFERPASTADAGKLAAAGAKVLAGGQTLLASMKLRLANPSKLADLGGIAELAGICREGNATGHWRHDAPCRRGRQRRGEGRHPGAGRPGRRTSATGRCAPWARWAARWPTTTRPPVTPARCWAWAPRSHHQAQDCGGRLLPGHVHHRAGRRRAHHRHQLPAPKRAAYMKFKQPASRFALIGVFVAQTDSGVRVAVTGGATACSAMPGWRPRSARASRPRPPPP